MLWRSPWHRFAILIGFGLTALVTGCADRVTGIDLTGAASQSEPTAVSVDDPTAPDETVSVALPLVRPITLPELGGLTATGEAIEQRLGGVVTNAISGVEVVEASCAAEGGELEYGSAGDDLFETDGSGRIVERSGDGLVTLVVEADGSGEFYERNRGSDSLLTIKVASDGSGEYFREQGSLLTTLLVRNDGSGEYFSESADIKTTVAIAPDGSGSLFDQQESGLLTVIANADGSGEYYFSQTESAEDAGSAEITLLVRSDGSWQLTNQDDESRIELTVAADRSGTYARRSRNPLVFDFDTNQIGGRGDSRYAIELPATPRFTVDSTFPNLGRFGALSPPCATVLRFDAQLLFDFGESEVRPGSERTLGEVVRTLNDIGKPIEINGHTDSRGTDDRNLELSVARANAVFDALTDRKLDVRAEVNGYGESFPIAPNELDDGEDNPNGRALNRRVEIVIRE